MADRLLQEVNADIRAEKMAVLWKRYRQPLAVFCVALVLATAAGQWWQHHRETRGVEWMAQLSSAQQMLTIGDAEGAASAFGAVADEAGGDARDIARIWQARALVAADKKPDAIAALKRIDLRQATLWSDIACLRLAALDAREAGCLAAAAVSTLRSPRALWQAATEWEAGDKTKAAATLDALIADADAPEPIRAEAQSWRSAIAVK